MNKGKPRTGFPFASGTDSSMVSTQGVEPYRYRCGSLVRFDGLFVSVMTSYPSSLIMRLDFLFFLII